MFFLLNPFPFSPLFPAGATLPVLPLNFSNWLVAQLVTLFTIPLVVLATQFPLIALIPLVPLIAVIPLITLVPLIALVPLVALVPLIALHWWGRRVSFWRVCARREEARRLLNCLRLDVGRGWKSLLLSMGGRRRGPTFPTTLGARGVRGLLRTRRRPTLGWIG